MSYKNPTVINVPNQVGLDAAIAELQTALGTIPYLDKVFGRAWIHKEKRGNKDITLPKVYQGKKEYYNALPNGNFKASVFFIAEGDEESKDYSPLENNVFTRQVALIFWGDLKRIDKDKDFIFLEEIKMDVLRAIKYCKCFESYDSYVDERYSEIFKEFRDASDEINTQYLMYPYAGFRLSLTLIYDQPC